MINRQSRIRAGNIGYLCARLMLGIVFVYASYDKILHPGAFAQAIDNYQILPGYTVNAAALMLPWIELVMGLCLITGLWLPGAAALCVLMLGIFTGALVINEIRGIDVYCGCFTTQNSHGAANLWTVLRDLFFLAVSVYLLIRTFSGKKALYR